MKDSHVLIKDESFHAKTRIVSFKGDYKRFDIAIITTEQYENKKLILDLNSNRYALLNKENIAEKGTLEHAYKLTEIDAQDLRSFLQELL
ncbi:DUF3055 domain-containing protein [Aquibacillus saliphilus]|uniref:DUF3055 domain-containing protein n=1 Tax=Aquibacillus saliphilus TaxID=1909422 RepID=UPI001CF030A8|nr:DUF3055 domain-containing protein [Aquibacillus saliphilus]